MNNSLTTHPFELTLNPSACPGIAYGPEQAEMLNTEGLAAAQAVITRWPGYAPTPLIDLSGIAAAANIGSLHYKDEAHRFGLKSFKPLGGAYAVYRRVEAEIAKTAGSDHIDPDDILSGRYAKIAAGVTVTAATDGNHGRSVAWGARMFGCRCVIFINASVSQGREQAIASYGAEVRRDPGSFDDAVRAAAATAAAEGWHLIPDTSDGVIIDAPRNVTQGYAVMAAETIEQLPFDGPPTHLFLQAGVGGMAAASAAQFWQSFGTDRPKVILVEPENAACWFASLQAAEPVVISGELESLMGGLACGEVSRLAWKILKTGADAALKLTDDAGADTMRLLAEGRHGDAPLVAGESGVAGLAGLLAVAADAETRLILELNADSRIVVFGTEGATDPETYAAIVGKTPEQVAA